MPNYNEVISRESYIFPSPEITGVAKGIWLCFQMKKPHSLWESSSQPWGTTEVQEPTPKGSFLTQGKVFCSWKNYAPADSGEQMGGRCFLHWERSAVKPGCSASLNPRNGLLLTRFQPFSPNPRWVIAKPSLDCGQVVPRWQMQIWQAEAARGAQTTSGFASPASEWEPQPARQWLPAASSKT